MRVNPYRAFFESPQTAEQFVRRVLQVLERDFRQLALAALADFDQAGLHSEQLFSSIAALQRPSWGSWNGLLQTLQSLSKKAERAPEAVQEQWRNAGTLSEIQKLLDQPTPPVLIERLGPLATACRTTFSKRTRLGQLLTVPIALRNRIAHDAPSDPIWWKETAQALIPLVRHLATAAPLEPVQSAVRFSGPWFLPRVDGVAAYNGLERDGTALFVTESGTAVPDAASGREWLLALQRLVGREATQEADFRKLLSRLAPEDVRGVLLGDYLVGREVGRGGFASVHVGRQLTTGRQVAIKLLMAGASPEIRLRFRQEAELLAKVSHPYVVSVFGYAEEAWLPPREFSLEGEPWFDEFKSGPGVRSFIAMEWIDGQTLDAVYKSDADHTATQPQILGWFAEVADALCAVHAAGLIHRDVKPANIMIDRRGRPVLMDFGIAQTQSDRSIHTTTGRVFGTPAYMSPEQLLAADAAKEIGPQTDVYSLCATFYELLTHRRLYDHDQQSGESVKSKKVGGERPAAPRVLVKSLPWELEVILLGGLERLPVDRYQSMEALRDDLRRVQRDEPIRYRRPSLQRRLQLAYRRHRVVANVSLAFVIVGGIGSSLFLRQIGAAKKGESEAMVQAEKDRLAKVEQEKKREEAERGRLWAEQVAKSEEAAKVEASRREGVRAYAAQLQRLVATIKAEQVDQLQVALNGCDERFRGWEWHYLRQQVLKLQPELQDVAVQTPPLLRARAGVELRDVAITPEGVARGAFVGDSRVEIWEGGQDSPLMTFKPPEGAQGCRLSSDAESVLIDCGNNTQLICSVRPPGTEILRIKKRPGWLQGPVFCPELRNFAVQTSSGVLINPNLEEGADGLVLKVPAHKVAFSSDGRTLATVHDDGKARAWDVASGDELRVVETGLEFVSDVAVANGGTTLVVSGAKISGDHRILAFAEGVETVAAALVLRGLGQISGLSSDGRYLARFDSQAAATVVTDLTTRREIVRHPNSMLDPVSFSEDGSLIAIGGIPVRVVRLSDQKSLLERQGSRHNHLRLAGTGDRLVTGGSTEVSVFEVNGGTPTERDPGALGPWQGLQPVDAAFSAPDRLVVLSADHRVQHFDLKNQVLLGTVRLAEPLDAFMLEETQELPQNRRQQAFFGPGAAIIAVLRKAGPIQLFDTSTGNLRAALERQTGLPLAIAFSPVSDELCVLENEETIGRYSMADGRRLGEFVLGSAAGTIRPARFGSLSYSRDGQFLAVVRRGNGRGECSVISTADGSPLPPLNSPVDRVAFLNSTTLVVDSGQTYELPTLAVKQNLNGLFRGPMLVTPDELRIVDAGIRDRASGIELPSELPVFQAARCSPDGRYLVNLGASIEVYDCGTSLVDALTPPGQKPVLVGPSSEDRQAGVQNPELATIEDQLRGLWVRQTKLPPISVSGYPEFLVLERDGKMRFKYDVRDSEYPGLYRLMSSTELRWHDSRVEPPGGTDGYRHRLKNLTLSAGKLVVDGVEYRFFGQPN